MNTFVRIEAMLKSYYSRAIFLILLSAAVWTAAAAPASAQTLSNVTGSWSFDMDINGVFNNTQQWDLVQTGTSVTGTGAGNGFTWTISGVVSGNNFNASVSYNEITYTANYFLTVGTGTMTGTWSDSFNQSGGANGTLITVVQGQTDTTLACVRGPAAADDFVCTVTVAADEPPAPTGTVSFVTSSGSFRNGSDCALSANTTQSSTCGVTLIQPVGGFTPGQAVPVTATYGGDDNYLGSASSSAVTTITVLPTSPVVCLSEADTACGGLSVGNVLEPEIVGNTFGTISLGYFAPVNGRSDGPFQPAAKISAPRGAGEIAVEFRYVARLRDNPQLIPTRGSSREIKQIASSIRNGLIISSVQSKVGFGQRKEVVLNLNSKGQRLAKSLRGSSISQLKLSIAVGVRRKGDRRGTSIASVTDATIR